MIVLYIFWGGKVKKLSITVPKNHAKRGYTESLRIIENQEEQRKIPHTGDKESLDRCG